MTHLSSFKSPKIAAIVAMDSSRLIGSNGELPWRLKSDLARFKGLTTGHVVVMGRRTWDSLPPSAKPLPGRTNLVISRRAGELVLPNGVLRAGSPKEGLDIARSEASRLGCSIWVIGGAELYRALIPLCDEVYLTVVQGSYQGDTWLEPFEEGFELQSEEQGEGCKFITYRRRGAITSEA
jgi:dihydrofolate reductase